MNSNLQRKGGRGKEEDERIRENKEKRGASAEKWAESCHSGIVFSTWRFVICGVKGRKLHSEGVFTVPNSRHS